MAKEIALKGSRKELLIALLFLENFSMNLRTRQFKSVSKTLPQYKIIFILKIV